MQYFLKLNYLTDLNFLPPVIYTMSLSNEYIIGYIKVDLNFFNMRFGMILMVISEFRVVSFGYFSDFGMWRSLLRACGLKYVMEVR